MRLTPTFLALLPSIALALPAGPVQVTKVVDGDTIHVVDSGGETHKIRLVGIDCPESRKVAKCGSWRDGLSCENEIKLGKAAKERATELLHNQTVTLESAAAKKRGKKRKTEEKDRYGRELAYVRLADGRDANLEMIRIGGCKSYGYKYPHPRLEEYDRSERGK